MLGLAASLVLAVGVAWRLRPVPEGVPGSPAARPAARMATESATGDGAARPPEPEHMAGRVAEDRGVTTAARNAEAPHVEAAAESPPAASGGSTPPAPMAQSKAAAAAISAAASQSEPAPRLESTPIESPPPPAPPAPVSAADDAAPPAPAEPVSPPQAFGDEAARAASAVGDEPPLEVPPATADSPAVRDAWLQRIQALVDAGDIAGAKASLRAFVLRYPDYTLPENLRALVR